MDRLGGRRMLFVAVALALAAVVVYLTTAFAEERFTRGEVLIPLAIAALALAAALWGLWTSARAAATAAARESEAEERIAERERELERARREREQRDRAAHEEHDRARKHEEELGRAHKLLQHLRQAREAEKRHTRELRSEIARIGHERGPLGDPRDVPSLVLRVSTTLLDAKKGLLLARRDDDRDGDLDLLAAEGFEHDPEHSGLVQRFAGEVIERDTTIREDEPPEGDSDADREIENLVAIPIYVRDEFSGVVVAANKDGGFHEHDDEVLLALGDHAGAVLGYSRMHGQLRGAYLATIAMVAEALEAKDPLLRGHSEDVAGYVRAVAEHLDVASERREELMFASLMHDVGKIGVSERILLKPGALTDEERAVIELHPRIGARIIEKVPALRPMTDAILHHHERWDGGGYPTGLSGEQIPVEARVIAVADAFSAMTTERPYRGAMSVHEACEELERNAGTQFDPTVVRHFVEEVRKRPPGEPGSALADAMEDPEVASRREGDEPLLGFGAFAVTDSLTLLYSHSHFQDVVRAEAERSRIQEVPFAVVLLELVDVPELNRSEGFAAGDAAIRAAARAAAAAATRLDGTAARYGGRRLGLAVPRYDLDRAKVLAEELADQSAAESTVRYGAAAWEPGDAGIDVIERARRALAAAAAASDGSHAGVGGDGADMAEKEPAHAGESPASA